MLTSILFDVGGTIIDTGSWSSNIKEVAFKHIRNVHDVSEKEFDAYFSQAMSAMREKRRGNPHVDKIKEVAGSIGDSVGMDDSGKRALEEYVKGYRLDNISTHDNAEHILADLHERFDLYVVSNSRTDNINSFLEKLPMKQLFKGVFISQELGARKEDGELFRIFLEKTGLNPKNCLMVGNDPSTDGRSVDFGIPFCLIDRDGAQSGENYTFRIGSIEELEDVTRFFERDMKKECHFCKTPVLNRIVCESCGNEFKDKVAGDSTLSGFVSDLSRFTGLTDEQTMDNLLMGPLLVRNDWVKEWPTTPEEINDFYARNTNYIYDLTVANMQDEWRSQNDAIVKYALSNRYMDILDYGCGTAQPLLHLAEAGKRVAGVDVSDYTLKYVKDRFSRRNLDISLSKTMMDGKFDMILCMDMLEHVVDPVGEAAAIIPHVKKGGAMALTMRMSRKEDYTHPMHLATNAGKEKEIRKLLSDRGFVREDIPESPRGMEIWKKAKG